MKGGQAKRPKAGVCVGCGCTHTTPCISKYLGRACYWIDRAQTVCSACYAPLAFSSADENVEVIRRETRVPLLERCLGIFNGEIASGRYGVKSITRAKAVEIRLRALAKVPAAAPKPNAHHGGLRAARGGA